MTQTILGLLRHGQTDWNIDFRLQGTSDIPLNATGIAQARAVAEGIDADWDVVLASPLSRAIDTANIVRERHGFSEVAIMPLLLERSFGEAEGLLYETWREKYPDSVVPGGESLQELEARAMRLLDEIVRLYSGQRVLAVSHGALIRKLLKLISKGAYPREGERLGNASLSTFVHNGSAWQVLDYNPKTIG
jgi:broad specificity phosphatase PhoE